MEQNKTCMVLCFLICSHARLTRAKARDKARDKLGLRAKAIILDKARAKG